MEAELNALAQAKARLSIKDLWQHFGFEGEPKPSCRCPWRDDHKPSFSVSRDGSLFNDFATGEGGDAVDFFQRASGLSKAEACRKFIQLAGGSIAPTPRAARHAPAATAPRARPSFPAFRHGTRAELRQLAGLRRLSLEAVELAQARGLLHFGTVRGFPSWIVADSAGLNAQARRLDGHRWEHLDGQPKAQTLPGSRAGWPIGTREAEAFPNIALVEGMPDLLAAFHFIHCQQRTADCTALAMLGASQRIPEDALPGLAGKRIRAFRHADDPGQQAGERWARQLEAIGAEVDFFDFHGLRQGDEFAVKDLNDLTAIHADDFEDDRSLWNLLP